MSLTTTYEYDLNGNVTQKTLANGAVENRSYDSRNRVTEVQNVGSAGVLSQYDYTFDYVGNVTQVAETYPYGALTARTIVNQYDGANRLTNEQITTGLDVVTTVYNYDDGHNRTSKVVTGGSNPGTTSYVIGDGANGAGANQILSVTLPDSMVIGFSYDGNGNRIAKTIGVTSDTYTYDEENRLISLQKNLGANTGLYSYGYDYRTRRVSRTEPGSADATLAVFNGGTSIEEYPADSAPSSPSVEFVRGEGQGGGVGGLEYNGSAVFNQYNSRGDVVGQTDGTGAVTYQAGYEAFGKHPDESGSSVDRQRANTKEQDPTGLLNEGFRYRDLETGTFVTRDPLGFAAGPNGYIYCGQNPWTHFDPEGLDIWIGNRYPHQNINVGDPHGVFSSYSLMDIPNCTIHDFPLYFNVLNPWNKGIVYVDDDPATPDEGMYLITTKEEDKQALAILNGMVKERLPYRLVNATCRDFSREMLEYFADLFGFEGSSSIPTADINKNPVFSRWHRANEPKTDLPLIPGVPVLPEVPVPR